MRTGITECCEDEGHEEGGTNAVDKKADGDESEGSDEDKGSDEDEGDLEDEGNDEGGTVWRGGRVAVGVGGRW
jgi:hypothetical protein